MSQKQHIEKKNKKKLEEINHIENFEKNIKININKNMASPIYLQFGAVHE